MIRRLFCLPLMLSIACGDKSEEQTPDPSSPPANRLPTDTRQHSSTGQSWTFLVYMVADNNLEPFALQDLNEMMEIGSAANFNIAVQIDRADGYTADAIGGIADFTSTKRFVVERGSLREIADLGEMNMGDPAALIDFMGWGIKTYPADRVALIFWDHGGAWPGFGGDESTSGNDVLDLSELASGIRGGLSAANLQSLALIGFDACLMSTFETAVTLREFGEYMLASEELEPGHGWDYRVLSLLRDAPGTAPKELGARLINGFKQQAVAEQTDKDVTLALTDLHQLANLANAISDFADALDKKAAEAAPFLGVKRAEALEFGKAPDPARSTHMVDILDLASQLASADSAAFGPAKDALTSALSQAVVAKDAGPLTQRAGGLSIYYPLERGYYDAGYDRVAGVDAWRKFLTSYHGAGQAAAGDAPRFDVADHAAEAGYVGEDILISAPLMAGAAERVAVASLTYGVIAEDSSIIVLGDQPAQLTNEGRIEALWNASVLTVSQNGEQGYAYLSVTEADGFLAADIPFSYLAPGATEAQYVILNYVIDLATQEAQATYYVITDGGPGELSPEPGAVLYPLLQEIRDGSATWILGSANGFDAIEPIDLAFERLNEGTTVIMQLEIGDFAGNGDYASFSGTL